MRELLLAQPADSGALRWLWYRCWEIVSAATRRAFGRLAEYARLNICSGTNCEKDNALVRARVAKQFRQCWHK